MAAEQIQSAVDFTTAQLLEQVYVYLPSLHRASGTRTSDHLVHPAALAHLRRRTGFINDLLRNDSLSDMSMRSGLYRILFDWLEVGGHQCGQLARSRTEILSTHEALASILAMPQMRPAKSEPVAEISQNTSGGSKQVLVTYESTFSPRELLENCSIQAQAALRGLQVTATTDEFVRTRGDRELEIQMTSSDTVRREARKLEEDSNDENIQLILFW